MQVHMVKIEEDLCQGSLRWTVYCDGYAMFQGNRNRCSNFIYRGDPDRYPPRVEVSEPEVE